jgi:hypothetical protein
MVNNENKEKLIRNNKVRHELLFSYWILAWAILYYFLYMIKSSNIIIKNILTWFNPTIALYISLLYTIISFFYLLVYYPDIQLLYFVILMCLSIKVFPIYLLLGTKINIKSNIISSIAFFIIYSLYLYSNNISIYDIYITNIVYITQYDSVVFFNNIYK